MSAVLRQALRAAPRAMAASKLTARLPSLAVAAQRTMSTARVTFPAPDFKGTALVNGSDFKEISLEQYKGKYVVLVFYPLNWTFVCPTEIRAHNDRMEDFKAINAEVIVASVDSHFSHHAWANTPRKEGGLHPMKIPMLSDISHSISSSYGVLGDDGFCLRGTYIIDDKGILRHMTINDRPVGRSVDEALRLIKAFQFADKNGEVCPADWQEGGDTIKPDVVGKNEYFGKSK